MRPVAAALAHVGDAWHATSPQLGQGVFTPVFQSQSRTLPLLRDLLMEPLDQIPSVQRLAARIVAGQVGLGSHRG